MGMIMGTIGHWIPQKIISLRLSILSINTRLVLVLISLLMPLLLMATGCGRIMGADPLVQRAVTLEVLRSQVAIAQEYSTKNNSPKTPKPQNPKTPIFKQ